MSGPDNPNALLLPVLRVLVDTYQALPPGDVEEWQRWREFISNETNRLMSMTALDRMQQARLAALNIIRMMPAVGEPVPLDGAEKGDGR